MDRRILTAAALFGATATALTQASGQAIVINNCNYDVDLDNVPAAGQGGTAVSQTLSPGDQYSQYFTGLEAPHDGWSMKLAPSNDPSGAIAQYEYTYLPESLLYSSIVWFDMSFVNGDPFNNDWAFSSNDDTCSSLLRHAAYAYSTDDAWGMQKPCSCDANIVLTLCPSSGGSSSGASSGSSSSSGSGAGYSPSSSSSSSAPPASSSPAAAPAAPAGNPLANLPIVGGLLNFTPDKAVVVSSSPIPTTFSTSTSSTTSVAPSTTPAPAAPASADGPSNLMFGGDGYGMEGKEVVNKNIDVGKAKEVEYITKGNTVIALAYETVNVYHTVDAPAAPTDAAAHKRHLHKHAGRHHHA